MTDSNKSVAAVLYIPAVNEQAGSGAIDGAAQRIARTLDHVSTPIGTQFLVREAAPEKFGSGGLAEVREILRLEPGQSPDQAVLSHRVFHLPYHSALDEVEHPNLIKQAGRLFWSWFLMMLRFVRIVPLAHSLSSRQKIAMAVGGFCLLLVTLYLLVAVFAIVHVVLNLTGQAGSPVELGTFDKIVAGFDDVLDTFFGSRWTRLFGVLSLLGLSSGLLRGWIEEQVKTYLRFCCYFESAKARATSTGMFNELLEHVLSGSYGRVDVIAYSMGSLVTMDAVFPADGQTARGGSITTLTTIGCPFDLVRTLWPEYFGNRDVTGSKLKWFNVYSPVDLRGSNFANDEGVIDKPTRGINAAAYSGEVPNLSATPWVAPDGNLYYDPMGRQKLGTLDALIGGAYQAHAHYWVPDQPAADSCYKRFVPLVYAVEPAGG